MKKNTSLFDLFFQSEEAKQKVKGNISSASRILSRYALFNIMLCFIPIALAYVAYSYSKKKLGNINSSYTAKVEFIETSKLTTSSGIPSLSQYSILGLNNATDVGDDVVRRVLESQEVLAKAFFSPTRNGDDLLINQFIEVFLKERGGTEKPFNLEKINRTTTVSQLSNEEKELFDAVQNTLFDPENGIFQYTSESTRKFWIVSPNQDLSLSLTNELYNSLEDFYSIREKGDRKKTRNIFEVNKSITLQEIKQLQKDLAKSQEKTGLRITREKLLLQQELAGKLMIAREKYAQYVRQGEEVKMVNQQNDKSKFKILSKPIYPLEPYSPNNKMKIIMYTVIAAVLGLMIIFFIFLLNQFYRFLKY